MKVIIIMAEVNRTKYLRLEKEHQELWKKIKKYIPNMEKMLEHGPATTEDIHIIKSILCYILAKNDIEEIDKSILEREIR